MSALSTHHKRTKRSEKKRNKKAKNSSKWHKTQKGKTSHLLKHRSIPLRQGQRLDAIDQKPKHDSSKTEVTLDAVMLEVEEKRGKPGARNKAETPQAKLFPLTSATLPKWCTLKALCTTSFSKFKQVSPLFKHFSQNSPPCWHMHTSSLKRPKAPPETETPPEQMLCNECSAGGVNESIHGYMDMNNI